MGNPFTLQINLVIISYFFSSSSLFIVLKRLQILLCLLVICNTYLFMLRNVFCIWCMFFYVCVCVCMEWGGGEGGRLYAECMIYI